MTQTPSYTIAFSVTDNSGNTEIAHSPPQVTLTDAYQYILTNKLEKYDVYRGAPIKTQMVLAEIPEVSATEELEEFIQPKTKAANLADAPYGLKKDGTPMKRRGRAPKNGESHAGN